MSIINLIDRPAQRIPTEVAELIFAEILSALGGYALLEEALEITPSYLCRGMQGELILRFDGCDRTNKVKVELDGVDSYAMTFYRFSFAPVDRGCQVVGKFEGIDRDQLQHCFEEVTGLSLVPIIDQNKKERKLKTSIIYGFKSFSSIHLRNLS